MELGIGKEIMKSELKMLLNTLDYECFSKVHENYSYLKRTRIFFKRLKILIPLSPWEARSAGNANKRVI